MKEELPEIDSILHFHSLTLLRIYDVLMHLLQREDKVLAAKLEALHNTGKFGVEIRELDEPERAGNGTTDGKSGTNQEG